MCGINQRVLGSSPRGGAQEPVTRLAFFVMTHIYILRSVPSQKYYVGSSKDPWRRLIEHNTSKRVTYTAKHRPWALMAVFQVIEGSKSVDYLERFIKNQKSKSLIERLIDPAFVPEGILAQLVRVPHVRD